MKSTSGTHSVTSVNAPSTQPSPNADAAQDGKDELGPLAEDAAVGVVVRTLARDRARRGHRPSRLRVASSPGA